MEVDEVAQCIAGSVLGNGGMLELRVVFRILTGDYQLTGHDGKVAWDVVGLSKGKVSVQTS